MREVLQFLNRPMTDGDWQHVGQLETIYEIFLSEKKILL
jgi:hypothetical protein